MMRLSAPIYQLKRRAKSLVRDQKIALHEALDRIAREEGFAGWSLLSSHLSMTSPSKSVLSQLAEGDLFLLSARPGHGKTLLGLQLLLDVIREGRRAIFYTLEYTEREVMERVRTLDANNLMLGDKLEIVTTDKVSANFIVEHLSTAPRETVAIVDYLQILDQQRSKPALSDQIHMLQDFARRTGIILGFISQIDRSFEPENNPIPDLRDIRLPNPIPLRLFSKACFLHDGKIRFQNVA